MTPEEIHENLCYYDPRYPGNEDKEEEDLVKPKECFCDNCFYGRTPLAEYIIELKH